MKRLKNARLRIASSLSMFIISGYPHPALSQLRVTPVSASICWEREVLLQVGAAGRPHLQAFSPHQRRAVRLNLKPAAGEGNQRGGDCSLRL